MTYRVLLRKEPLNGYTATALDWPSFQVSASTRHEALEQIRAEITNMLATSEVVDLEVPAPITPASYEDTFGMFRHDPTWNEFLIELNQYRQERNQVSAE